MARSIIVGELRTGRRITTIPVRGASWAQVLRDGGDVGIDIPLGADEFARYERTLSGLWPGPDLFLPFYPTPVTGVWRPGQGMRPEFLAALDPARCFLAACEGSTVLEAGPIWAHRYNHRTNTLSVKAGGLGSLFDRRRVMGIVADGTAAAAWTETWSGVSLATMVKMLMEQAESHTGGDLPIVFADDETTVADADHTRTWNGFDLGTTWDRVKQLMDVTNGPDVALEPRLTADRLGVVWDLRTGTEADPLLGQHSGDWVFDSRVPEGGVGDIDVTRDATGMASRSWVTGGGLAESTLMEFADDTTMLDRGYPLMESVDARGSVSERSTLASWAAANLAGKLRPWMEWSLLIRADRFPWTARPGDWAKVWISDRHAYLRMLVPAGFHRARIARIEGGLGRFVRVVLIPEMEIR